MSDEPTPIDEGTTDEPLDVEQAPAPVDVVDDAALEAEKRRLAEAEKDADVNRVVKRMSRRGFLTAAVATGAGYGAWKWLRTRQQIGYLEWPLRRVLELNESIAEVYFRS